MNEEMHPNFCKILKEMMDRHREKNTEHGMDNLYVFGPTYQMMRIIDRTGRMKNFLKGTSKVSIEKIREDLLDTAVHAVLAICMMDEGIKILKVKEYETEIQR